MKKYYLTINQVDGSFCIIRSKKKLEELSDAIKEWPDTIPTFDFKFCDITPQGDITFRQDLKDAYNAARQTENDDETDQDTKRQVRMAQLRAAFDDMDAVIASPVRLRRLLKRIIISIVRMREE